MKIFIINLGLHMSCFLKVGYIYSYSFAFKSKSFLWLMGDEEVKRDSHGQNCTGHCWFGDKWDNRRLYKQKVAPGWLPARKWGPQSYNCKGLSSANNLKWAWKRVFPQTFQIQYFSKPLVCIWEWKSKTDNWKFSPAKFSCQLFFTLKWF